MPPDPLAEPDDLVGPPVDRLEHPPLQLCLCPVSPSSSSVPSGVHDHAAPGGAGGGAPLPGTVSSARRRSHQRRSRGPLRVRSKGLRFSVFRGEGPRPPAPPGDTTPITHRGASTLPRAAGTRWYVRRASRASPRAGRTRFNPARVGTPSRPRQIRISSSSSSSARTRPARPPPPGRGIRAGRRPPHWRRGDGLDHVGAAHEGAVDDDGRAPGHRVDHLGQDVHAAAPVIELPTAVVADVDDVHAVLDASAASSAVAMPLRPAACPVGVLEALDVVPGERGLESGRGARAPGLDEALGEVALAPAVHGGVHRETERRVAVVAGARLTWSSTHASSPRT